MPTRSKAEQARHDAWVAAGRPGRFADFDPADPEGGALLPPDKGPGIPAEPKRGPGRPPGRRGSLAQPVQGMLATLGTVWGMSTRGRMERQFKALAAPPDIDLRARNAGETLVVQAPEIAAALDQLAQTDEAVRKWLTAVSGPGGWIGVGMAAWPVLVAAQNDVRRLTELRRAQIEEQRAAMAGPEVGHAV